MFSSTEKTTYLLILLSPLFGLAYVFLPQEIDYGHRIFYSAVIAVVTLYLLFQVIADLLKYFSAPVGDGAAQPARPPFSAEETAALSAVEREILQRVRALPPRRQEALLGVLTED